MRENYAKPSQQGMLTLKPMRLYQVEANQFKLDKTCRPTEK